MRHASLELKRNLAIALAALIAAAVVIAAVTTGLGSASVPSGAVAIVDDVDDGTVSQEELDAELERAAPQLGLEEVPEPDDPQYATLRDQAMQSLLLSVWVEAEADELGIEITPEEVDARLEEIKEESFENEREFNRFVRQQGFSEEDVLRQVRLTLIEPALQEEVVGQPEISDKEVERFYDANVDRFEQPASRDLRVVLNEDEGRAERALEQLSEDDSEESWERVADRFSEDQATKDRGGLQEGMVEGQGEQQLEEQAFAASEGELVGPFETERGFYVIQVIETRDSRIQPLEEVEEGIRGQLQQGAQQQIASDFQRDFNDKWAQRTVCVDEIEIQLCGNFDPEFEAPEGEAAEAPVMSNRPIEPGTAFLTGDGTIQQRLPDGSVSPPQAQRPLRAGDPCEGPDGTEVPCGPEEAQPEPGPAEGLEGLPPEALEQLEGAPGAPPPAPGAPPPDPGAPPPQP